MSSKSATTSDFTLLRQAGFTVRSHKANPAIKNRLQAMNKMLEDRKYMINVDQCPLYADSLEQQIYNESTGQPDKENDLDHPVDAGGYFIHYRWPIRKNTFSVNAMGG